MNRAWLFVLLLCSAECISVAKSIPHKHIHAESSSALDRVASRVSDRVFHKRPHLRKAFDGYLQHNVVELEEEMGKNTKYALIVGGFSVLGLVIGLIVGAVKDNYGSGVGIFLPSFFAIGLGVAAFMHFRGKKKHHSHSSGHEASSELALPDSQGIGLLVYLQLADRVLDGDSWHTTEFMLQAKSAAHGGRKESGNLRFELFKVSRNEFYFYEVYRNEEAIGVHKSIPDGSFQNWASWRKFGEGGNMLDQKVTRTTLIAATSKVVDRPHTAVFAFYYKTLKDAEVLSEIMAIAEADSGVVMLDALSEGSGGNVIFVGVFNDHGPRGEFEVKMESLDSRAPSTKSPVTGKAVVLSSL